MQPGVAAYRRSNPASGLQQASFPRVRRKPTSSRPTRVCTGRWFDPVRCSADTGDEGVGSVFATTRQQYAKIFHDPHKLCQGPARPRAPSFEDDTATILRRHALSAYKLHKLEPNHNRPQGNNEINPSNTFKGWVQDVVGRTMYNYYNWRKDTLSDLQLFLVLNLGVVALGGVFKRTVVNSAESAWQAARSVDWPDWWLDLYEVGTLMFGNDFPDSMASRYNQLFSLVMATIGLATFALVLALVEQVVLEIIDENVRHGSRVYEEGHVREGFRIVVLAWGESQRDLEVLQRIITQMCLAYRACGGTTIVVLAHRSKIEMENMFWRAVPEPKRFRSTVVFRQGSPLEASDLRNVAVSTAAATIVIGDSARSAEDADAQVVRAAVTLDELDFPGFGVADRRTGHIVVELKTMEALSLLEFSCSPRILPLPSNLCCARRIARMVQHPVVAMISRYLWDLTHPSSGFCQAFPHLAGRRFGDLHFYFSDASLLGLLNAATGQLRINPRSDERLGPDDL